jgi:hypothetical protein
LTESGVGVGSRRPDCAGFERSRELGGWVAEKPGRSGRRRTVERSGTVELGDGWSGFCWVRERESWDDAGSTGFEVLRGRESVVGVGKGVGFPVGGGGDGGEGEKNKPNLRFQAFLF